MTIRDKIPIYTQGSLWYSRVLNNWWLYEMKYQSNLEFIVAIYLTFVAYTWCSVYKREIIRTFKCSTVIYMFELIKSFSQLLFREIYIYKYNSKFVNKKIFIFL